MICRVSDKHSTETSPPKTETAFRLSMGNDNNWVNILSCEQWLVIATTESCFEGMIGLSTLKNNLENCNPYKTGTIVTLTQE